MESGGLGGEGGGWGRWSKGTNSPLRQVSSRDATHKRRLQLTLQDATCEDRWENKLWEFSIQEEIFFFFSISFYCIHMRWWLLAKLIVEIISRYVLHLKLSDICQLDPIKIWGGGSLLFKSFTLSSTVFPKQILLEDMQKGCRHISFTCGYRVGTAAFVKRPSLAG